MWSLVLTSVWQFFPFVVVTFLARLQTIPPELYEAAKVDGAGAWRRFLHVTLPQTRNVLFVIILLRSIFMFTKFDTVWLMAGEGGVSRYVRTLPVYAYARSFTYLQAGMGAALAVLMFLLLLVATAVYFRALPRRGDWREARAGALRRRPGPAGHRRLPAGVDAVHRAQALGRDLRDAAHADPAGHDAGELRAALRRDQLPDLLRQQRRSSRWPPCC